MVRQKLSNCQQKMVGCLCAHKKNTEASDGHPAVVSKTCWQTTTCRVQYSWQKKPVYANRHGNEGRPCGHPDHTRASSMHQGLARPHPNNAQVSRLGETTSRKTTGLHRLFRRVPTWRGRGVVQRHAHARAFSLGRGMASRCSRRANHRQQPGWVHHHE